MEDLAGKECLSFPDLLANVKRAQKIRLTAWIGGSALDLSMCRFEAVAIQHEIDHWMASSFWTGSVPRKTCLKDAATGPGP